MKTNICKDSTVVRAKEQVSCDLAGESVILNLKSGVYYGLNPVGARVWELIQEPRTVSAVLDVLLKQYDVEVDRCEGDLFALLEDLAARELIVIEAGNNGVGEA
jgi:Coenzyme PQQ synthesis protein D (PqqD)